MVRSGEFCYGGAMMTRTFIAAFAFSGLLLGTAVPAYAQVTDQTDQSEEDWRKSRKKRGSSDIYERNTTTIGNGLGTIGEIKPVSPVERLPSESRRHLMKKRAEAIANSPDGSISDAAFEPSEAAKSDEALRRDEEEAWEVITTDMEGAGGQATTPSQGGPNKVAVAGRNGTAPAPGSRGGSTATLQEIMDAIKSGRMGNGSGGGQGNGQGSGQGGAQGDGQGDGSAPQPGAVAGVGSLPQGQPGSQGQADGSAQGSGQDQGDGQPAGSASGQDGQAQDSATQGDNLGQAQQAGDGEAQADAQAQADSRADAQARADALAELQGSDLPGDADDRAQREREALSPLERMRRAREEREAGGSERSASDYLGRR